LSSGRPSGYPPGEVGGPGPPAFAAASGDRSFYIEGPYFEREPARQASVSVLAASIAAWTLAPPQPLGDPIPLPAGAPRYFGLVTTLEDIFALAGGKLFRFPMAREVGPWIEEPAPRQITSIARCGVTVCRTLRSSARLERRTSAGAWVSWGTFPSGTFPRILESTADRVFLTASGYPGWMPAHPGTAEYRPIDLAVHSRRGQLLDGGDRLVLAEFAPEPSIVHTFLKDSGCWTSENLQHNGHSLILRVGERAFAISAPANSAPGAPDRSQHHVWFDGLRYDIEQPAATGSRPIGVSNGEVHWQTFDDVNRPKVMQVRSRSLAEQGAWRASRPPLALASAQARSLGTWLAGTRVCIISRNSSLAWNRGSPLWCSDGEGQDWKAIPFPLTADAEGLPDSAGNDLFIFGDERIWRLGARRFEKLGPPLDVSGMRDRRFYSRPAVASDAKHLYVAFRQYDGAAPLRRISLTNPQRWEIIRWQPGIRVKFIESLVADAKRNALFLSTDQGPLRLDLPGVPAGTVPEGNGR